MKWFLKCLKQYADFSGRARRKEYWMFVLFELIFTFVAAFIDGMMGMGNETTGLGVLGGIFSLAMFIPSLAVSVRRLHDIGKSGWYILLGFIPLVGGIILLIWYCTDSQAEENEWGENPKMFEI